MKYHKKLQRTDLLRYGWRTILMMAASEFSRASNLAANGGGKERQNCLLRAKELLGVMETDGSIPKTTASKLLALTNIMKDPFLADPSSMYKKSMQLAS